MLPPCETSASRVSDRHPGVDGLLCLPGSGIISSQTKHQSSWHTENYCACFKVIHRGWIGNLRCLLSQKRIIKLEQDGLHVI